MRTTVLAALLLSACASAPLRTSTPEVVPQTADLSELWVEPEDLAARDLFAGPWGLERAPAPSAHYEFVARKAGGWSPGYTVRDPGGVVWSVKQGPEAQAEVTASRLLWALGYHQPPVYYLPSWHLRGSPRPGVKGPGRFRPEIKELRKLGEWDYVQNPFVGTPQLQGLLVMMLMLNNSDLKASNNTLYERQRPDGSPERWFVVRDVGHSFGETGRWNADRNDIDEFEREAFIRGVKGGIVQFNYSGRHRVLFRGITPEHVRWTCQRLARLSERQWGDAFRAGGYEPALATRFIRRFQQKVREGLEVKP